MLCPCALKCVFLCYSNSQKHYRSFHPTGKYFASMDVLFFDQVSYFSGNIFFVPLQEEIDDKEEEQI